LKAAWEARMEKIVLLCLMIAIICTLAEMSAAAQRRQ
jgi:hypothetical protein